MCIRDRHKAARWLSQQGLEPPVLRNQGNDHRKSLRQQYWRRLALRRLPRRRMIQQVKVRAARRFPVCLSPVVSDFVTLHYPVQETPPASPGAKPTAVARGYATRLSRTRMCLLGLRLL